MNEETRDNLIAVVFLMIGTAALLLGLSIAAAILGSVLGWGSLC